jgi:hypothetical protein
VTAVVKASDVIIATDWTRPVRDPGAMLRNQNDRAGSQLTLQ